MRERRRGGQETHVELIFIHVLILVGSNGDDRSYCNEKQIKYEIELLTINLYKFIMDVNCINFLI